MNRINYRLLVALTLSFLMHLAPLLNEIISPIPPPTRPAPIEAVLRAAPAPILNQAPLILPDQETVTPSASQPKPAKPQIVSASSTPVRHWQDEVKRQIKKRDERGQFYPAQAIHEGLEGEALILMIIDPHGQVSASRLEQSSGHRLLDEAALQAVRSLHSLPADAPRETLLPVRFRLK